MNSETKSTLGRQGGRCSGGGGWTFLLQNAGPGRDGYETVAETEHKKELQLA